MVRPTAADPYPSSSQLKILLADPNPKFTEAVQEYMKRAGKKVVVVEDGSEVLRRARDIAPDVIVLELKLLSEMDGLEVCKQLRADEQTAHIPIIFLTALDDVVDKVVGLERGANDYIPKPLSLRELEARIAAVLRGRQAPQTGTRSPFEIRRVGGGWVEGGVLGKYFRGSYQLFVSDELVKRVEVTGGGEANGEDSVWFTIHVPDLEAFEPISGCSFNSIPATVDELILSTGEGVEFLRYVHMRRAESGGGVEYVFSLHPDLWEWQSPYSPGAYFQELKSMASVFQPWVDVELNDPDDGLGKGFYVKFSNLSETLPLAQLLTRCVDSLRNMQAGLDSSLSDDGTTLVSRFEFPNGLKVPCEQYLLYFGQFLHDLGVEATTDLKHEAGHVLFSVTPTDKEEALDNIREALMIYLGMSASPINNLDTLDYEIAVQRLVAEVQTLQGRFTLARAEMQLKEATIQQQQIAIDTLRPQGGGLLLESLSEVKPRAKDDDREEVIEGLVAVKKFEWKFLEVGVPELFRRLRQRLGKKDE
jgi:CheY-like chemotaxis protein